MKIQVAHIRKSYLKLQYVLELSHSAHSGINPPQKHHPLFFLAIPSGNCPRPPY